MVKRVTTAAALDRLRKAYRRHAGSWALQHLGLEDATPAAASVPLHPPTQRAAMQDQQAAIDWVTSWRAHTKMAAYVQWETRQWSLLGNQQVPVRLEMHEPAEVAAVLGQTKHWNSLLTRFETLHQQPANDSEEFRAALIRNTELIAALEEIDFQRLVGVLTWLAENPASNLYIRQLPIRGVDTKWIKEHNRLVTQLHIAHTGRTNLGIRAQPELWRIRLLDETMWLHGLSDITAPVEQLARLDIAPANVLIVENLISLLTLPPARDLVAIFGKGTAVSGLAQLPWIHQAQVLYWGDLDTHGYRILHSLRAAGIEASSLLMDLNTLKHFEDLWVTETQPFRGELGLLTTAETETLTYLQANPGTRLEQERIDWSYVLENLRSQGLLNDRLN